MGRGPLGNQDLDYCIQSAACRMCGIVSINMGQKEENYVGGQIIKAVFERRLYSGYEDSGDENANENTVAMKMLMKTMIWTLTTMSMV